ncbi:MAG: sialidase family protein [Caldilineaceae bacterium]
MRKFFGQMLVPLFVICMSVMPTTTGYAQPADPVDTATKVYLPLITGAPLQADQFASTPIDAQAPTTSEDMIDPENQVFASAVTPIRIDVTQDAKALGYPDSRKVVRQRTTEQLFVAYRKKYNGIYRIFITKSSDNGATWAVTNGGLPIDPATNFTQRVPSIAIDYKDTLHVVWYGADTQSATENDHQIRYMRSKDGGVTWEKSANPFPRIFGYTAGDWWQEHPMIYALDGTILIIWEGRVPCSPLPCTPSSRVKFIKSTDGGDNWSAIQTLPELGGRNFSHPTLVVARDQKTLYVFAYAAINSSSQIVWIKSGDLGNSWSTTGWQFIKSDTQDQRHVSVAIDSTDRLHVAWRQKPTGSAYSRILYAVYDTKNPTVAWSTQWLSAAKPNNHQFFPTIAVDGSDRVWLAWSEASSDPTGNAYGFPNENPLVGDIVAAMLNPSTGWQKSSYTASGKALYPVLRYQRYGRRALVDLVWLAGDGTEDCSATGCSIQYARLAGQ